MGTFNRSGNWGIDYYFRGRRKREMVGTSKRLAEQVLNKRLTEIAEGKYLDKKPQQKITFEVFSRYYLENYAIPNKRSWKETDKHYVKRLNSVFGKKYLYTISSYDIERFKSERIKEVSPASVNRELACLKTMFNKAIAWGYVSENPLRQIKLFKENNERVRFLNTDELKLLLSYCSDRLKRFVILAVATGMRKGEIQKLKQEDIDFTRNFIRISEQKNGLTSYIPMNNTARKVLEQGVDFDYNPRKAFELACKKAGIKDFRFHDLRHTFCSWLAMEGQPIHNIMRLARHKDIKMTLRYSHLSPESKAVSAAAIDSHILVTFDDTKKVTFCKSL